MQYMQTLYKPAYMNIQKGVRYFYYKKPQPYVEITIFDILALS